MTETISLEIVDDKSWLFPPPQLSPQQTTVQEITEQSVSAEKAAKFVVIVPFG
jgi:hypothetical protein